MERWNHCRDSMDFARFPQHHHLKAFNVSEAPLHSTLIADTALQR